MSNVRNRAAKPKIEVVCRAGQTTKVVTFSVPTEEKARQAVENLYPDWEIESMRMVA